MPWLPAPESLIETFSAVLPVDERVERRKMFSYPCAFTGGNMFAGLHETRMVLRLDERDRATFLALEGARIFTPMPGRTMREYVVVPDRMLAQREVLRPWVARALAYASSLPSKAAKGGKAAAKRKPATRDSGTVRRRKP